MRFVRFKSYQALDSPLSKLLETEVVGGASCFLVVETIDAEQFCLDLLGSIDERGVRVAGNCDDDGLVGGDDLSVGTNDVLRPDTEDRSIGLHRGENLSCRS